MKIGVLTYHRSHNYGALLQALALRYKLTEMGHEVCFIDYWPKYHQDMYSLFSMRYVLHCSKINVVKYILNTILYWNRRKKRIDEFEQFIGEYIVPYCAEYSDKNEYDIIVYGSDQIWRKQPGLSNHFNPVYFADNILHAKKHMSYAASMGMLKLDIEDYSFLRMKMKNFFKISVREKSLKEILETIGVNAPIVLDPTLLLTKTDWDELFPIKRLYDERYILYYRLSRSFDEKIVADFAKRKGCRLLILDGVVRMTKNKTIFAANPLQFLSLIKYADFVFSSSYHGMVFSLIFNKEFYACFPVNEERRAKSLLDIVNLSNRLLFQKDEIAYDIEKIDYKNVNRRIEELRAFSLDFLQLSM
ncbi:polysaccharide pyruvyl transferase family protein [Bacteroides cellulosilyticus]|uniref:polysaccharide pyruvyl transferase family protein n=1 Tax=Bacteroides cellulosilyticus TaxID=246787 RepID=UPI0022E50FD9|nr:polysaccharide pyruvyl transferase family protein [Bacteroides cellulosilyticus]